MKNVLADKVVNETYKNGVAIFQTDKYRIGSFLTDKFDYTVNEWFNKSEKDIPHFKTTNKIKIYGEIDLFVTISPIIDIQESNIYYYATLNQPNGNVIKSPKYILANNKMEKIKFI